MTIQHSALWFGCQKQQTNSGYFRELSCIRFLAQFPLSLRNQKIETTILEEFGLGLNSNPDFGRIFDTDTVHDAGKTVIMHAWRLSHETAGPGHEYRRCEFHGHMHPWLNPIQGKLD